jgi:hypothetical protein
MKRTSLIAGLLLLTFLTISCSKTSTPTASSSPQPQEIVPCALESKPSSSDVAQASRQNAISEEYEPGNQIAVVIANEANVRDDSSPNGAVLFNAEKNDLLLLDGDDQSGPWYRVIQARTGQKGWIHSDVIRLFSDQSLVAEGNDATSSQTDEDVEIEPQQRTESRPAYSALPLPSPTVSESIRAQRYEAPGDRAPAITSLPETSYSPQSTYSPPSYTPSYTTPRSSPPIVDYSPGTVNVRGYTRRDGTYVAPHVRTAPNSSKMDNWSTKGNVNPYTGKRGTKSPF